MEIILTSHLKRILRKKKSQVRSWKKTCGLWPTKEITIEKDCLRGIAPVELNGLNKMIILKIA